MIEAQKTRVAVNGYGVIVKRVAAGTIRAATESIARTNTALWIETALM
jgi:hypothetical protein